MIRVVVTRRTRPGPQTGFAANWSDRGWVIQRWHATECGQRFDRPLAAGPFPTKKRAQAVCRLLRQGCSLAEALREAGEVRDA